MLVPVVLLFFATLAAAVVAYGTHANWAQFSHGFEFIIIARRIQWIMAAISLALCLGMLGMIVAGRRRAWWLIGLAPVLVLFVHRFTPREGNDFLLVEDPPFVAGSTAGFVGEDDWVVGLQFAGTEYAYPYAALFGAPVVIHADHDQRLALMWSAYANRAMAVQVGRDFRAADVEVVSTPANALLLYNARLGQFVNGLTGLTPGGERPQGFREQIAIEKTTWKVWRARHPNTKVLTPLHAGYPKAPRAPIRAAYPLPDDSGGALDSRIVLVGRTQPVAVESEHVTHEPLNVSADGIPVFVFRDPDGVVRAFDRRIEADLRPVFRVNNRSKSGKAVFVDEDTGAGWDIAGRAVEGPPEIRGKRLAAIRVEDGLSLRLMRHWYPSLELLPASN